MLEIFIPSRASNWATDLQNETSQRAKHNGRSLVLVDEKSSFFLQWKIPHCKIPVDFLHDLPTVLTHVSISICVSIYHLSIHPSIRPSIHPFIHLLGSASHLANGFYHVIPPQSKKEAIPTEKYGIILDLLVVYLPLWKTYIKIWVGQLGLWTSQYMEQ